MTSLSTCRRHPEQQIQSLATCQACKRNLNAEFVLNITIIDAKIQVQDLGWRAAVAGRSGTANALRSPDSGSPGRWQPPPQMSSHSSARPSREPVRGGGAGWRWKVDGRADHRGRGGHGVCNERASVQPASDQLCGSISPSAWLLLAR